MSDLFTTLDNAAANREAAQDRQEGYDAGYSKLLLDPTRGRAFSGGYALGCEHRLQDDARAAADPPPKYSMDLGHGFKDSDY